MIELLKDVGVVSKIMGEYHDSVGMVHGFVPEIFRRSWNNLISTGIGTALAAYDAEPVGLLCMMISPDLYDGKKNAVIAVWYVTPGKRGGAGAKLYREAEKIAIQDGAVRMCAGYQLRNMDIMSDKYNKMGFTEIETYCVKEL